MVVAKWEDRWAVFKEAEIAALNSEIFCSMKELRVQPERWHFHYNTVRPRSSLGYPGKFRKFAAALLELVSLAIVAKEREVSACSRINSGRIEQLPGRMWQAI